MLLATTLRALRAHCALATLARAQALNAMATAQRHGVPHCRIA